MFDRQVIDPQTLERWWRADRRHAFRQATWTGVHVLMWPITLLTAGFTVVFAPPVIAVITTSVIAALSSLLGALCGACAFWFCPSRREAKRLVYALGLLAYATLGGWFVFLVIR